MDLRKRSSCKNVRLNYIIRLMNYCISTLMMDTCKTVTLRLENSYDFFYQYKYFLGVNSAVASLKKITLFTDTVISTRRILVYVIYEVLSSFNITKDVNITECNRNAQVCTKQAASILRRTSITVKASTHGIKKGRQLPLVIYHVTLIFSCITKCLTIHE